MVDGAVIPWEVTAPLKVHELVDTQTGFVGDHGLYTATMLFAMNEARYEALPDDLRAVIDANFGLETSAWAGRVLDEGDAPARRARPLRSPWCACFVRGSRGALAEPAPDDTFRACRSLGRRRGIIEKGNLA